MAIKSLFWRHYQATCETKERHHDRTGPDLRCTCHHWLDWLCYRLGGSPQSLQKASSKEILIKQVLAPENSGSLLAPFFACNLNGCRIC